MHLWPHHPHQPETPLAPNPTTDPIWNPPPHSQSPPQPDSPQLADPLHWHFPSRSLSSFHANLLTPTHRTNHQTGKDKAPSLWHSLPKHIRDCTDLTAIKTLTKTHLFKLLLIYLFYAFNALIWFFCLLTCKVHLCTLKSAMYCYYCLYFPLRSWCS